MKKKIIALSILVAAGMSFSACDELVEIEPQTALDSGTALSSVQSYQAVLTSVYDRLQSFNYYGRDFALLGDALADNIFTQTTLDTRYSAANKNTGGHYSIWGTAYAAINELNTILASIDALVVPESQEHQKQLIKAEALALRGMIYFDLARVYGYEPNNIPTSGQTAGFDKSVIIRTTPTLTPEDAAFMERSTATEVYNQVEADFKAAIAIFEATKATDADNEDRGSFFMNEAAAHGLLGKVYLYWERWSDAETELTLALDVADANGTAELADDYVDAFSSSPNPESLFEFNFVQSTEMAGVLGVNDSPYSYTHPTGTNDIGASTYGSQTPSDELRALFEPEDQRADFFFERAASTSGSNKYWWADKYNSSEGSYTDGIPVIRYADVMLMLAEAHVMQGETAPAIALLTELREAREASVNVIPTSATELEQFIRTERRRELYFEGHRWFDLKRYGDGITKPLKTNVTTLAHGFFRLLAPLPQGEVDLNDALVQNPGY